MFTENFGEFWKRNEKKKKETQRCWRRLNVIMLSTWRMTIHRRTRICQRSFNSARFPAYRCTLDACMHARNGCNKVFSDTCNDRTHSHSLPFAKYFGWLSRLCSLFHPFVCVMGTTIGQRDENHDPGKGKW